MAQYKVFLGSGGKFLVCVDIVNVLNACTHVCFFFAFCYLRFFFSIHVSKSLALKEKWFSTIGWNMTCRMSHSKQNKDGEIIIPAGQRPAAMKNGALRCKRVCGIFDWPEFSKCAPDKSKNEQTNKLTKKNSNKQTDFLWVTPCKSQTLQLLDWVTLVACPAHCTVVSCYTSYSRINTSSQRRERCGPGVDLPYSKWRLSQTPKTLWWEVRAGKDRVLLQVSRLPVQPRKS